jgi:hypothetical protein
MDALESLVSLSDQEIVDRLDRLAERDRSLGAEIVAHLIVVETRRIHLDWGYPSLFAYCTERLGFSEDVAYKRIQAARAAVRCPRILELLEDGELTLSSVKVLAPHLDEPEADELVESARGKSRREVERLCAARCPEPSRPRGQFRWRAVDGERFRLELTVGADFLSRLERAIDLDRHRNPEGDPVLVLTEALDLHIAAAEKRKHKVTDRPLARRSHSTQAVPAAVVREVHARDGGRCTFVGKDGRVCGATAFIEHDHVTPRAGGGEHSVVNGRQLCAQHNRRSAELFFGTEVIERARVREATGRDVTSARW